MTLFPESTMFILSVIHLNPFEVIYLSLLTPEPEKKKTAAHKFCQAAEIPIKEESKF